MKPTHAAVFEPVAAERRKLVAGVKQAGLTVSSALEPAALGKETVVLLGPSLTEPAKVAKAVRAKSPGALLLAAQKKLGRASFADGVIPLPLSPRDFLLRLPELLKLRDVGGAPPRGAAPMRPRPGEGILDPLTAFYTFAHFKEVLFIEVKRARRYGIPLGLAVVEFDPLPEPPDAALRAQLSGGLALSIRRSLRDTDYPVQLSVDRVLLLMPHTDLKGALVVSRRICERVAKASLEHGGKVLHPTLSIGVAAAPIPGQELSFSDLVSRAQSALAAAVEGGGNRVEFFDSAVGAAALGDDAPEA